MSEQLGIFTRYPESPGFKRSGTSSDAARSIEPRAKGTRQMVLDALRICEATPDQLAEMIGKSILSVRPRCSELLAQGLIEETGQRRKNGSNLMANVLRLRVRNG